jgi:hypothetical protein
MPLRQWTKKALFSAFFYCFTGNLVSANELIFKDLDPKIKSFVVLDYYDLKREASSANPAKLNEILLELNCEDHQFNKNQFLVLWGKTENPIDAVRLIEKIEVSCSK